MAHERCVRCGKGFACGRSRSESRCWCEELPPVQPVTDEGCLCRDCLAAEIESTLGRRAGLCASCRHAKRLTTKSKQVVFQCGRAGRQPEFAKFPRLPVSTCAGFEPR